MDKRQAEKIADKYINRDGSDLNSPQPLTPPSKNPVVKSVGSSLPPYRVIKNLFDKIELVILKYDIAEEDRKVVWDSLDSIEDLIYGENYHHDQSS